MALGKKIIGTQKSNSKHRPDAGDGELGLGLEFVQYKRGFGRKRIFISTEEEIGDLIFTSPDGKIWCEKLCDETSSVENGQSLELEDLPQDILVKIICGIKHEDLKQLFHVSKTIREATLIAEESHFAYCTPKKTSVFRDGSFCLDKLFNDDEEIEAPGAPLQKRCLSRINPNKDYSGVSVALFK